MKEIEEHTVFEKEVKEFLVTRAMVDKHTGAKILPLPAKEKIAQINLSNTSYRKNLSSSNFENDWFYGLGLGLSIKSSTIKANIGMNNLGDAGFVYGISIKKTL